MRIHTKFLQIFRRYYQRITESISFVPALISLSFLVAALLTIQLDFSVYGKWLLERIALLRLEDASTARSILATIVGGILSLTVFSFSLVMIMLNQTASNLTNRLLHSLLQEKFHQVTMGVYIGTIIFSLVMLFEIREVVEGPAEIPAIGVFIAIFLSIINIFLFIYFLDYVTQSVRFSNVIDRIYRRAKQQLQKHQPNWISHSKVLQLQQAQAEKSWHIYPSPQSGYLQDVQTEALVQLAFEQKIEIRLERHFGDFIVNGTPLFAVHGAKNLQQETIDNIGYAMDFYPGESIEENSFYGYRQLSEIAIKALSPGINDTQTAVYSMNALADLLAFKIHKTEQFVYSDTEETPRIYLPPRTFQHLFSISYDPILNYGKGDQQILFAMLNIIEQLHFLDQQQQLHSDFFKQYLKLVHQLAEEHIENPMVQSRIVQEAERLERELVH